MAPAIDFIASLGTGSNRRERLVSAFANLEQYENRLAELMRNELRQIAGVTLYQAAAGVAKTPTVAFRLDKLVPESLGTTQKRKFGA
ncbi:hypothetical protein [Brevibacillus agri]|uniref:hypothetical protein n=1 Tax=Brevibacillus agri TaxID=51101 RepID=UPI0035E3D985